MSIGRKAQIAAKHPIRVSDAVAQDAEISEYKCRSCGVMIAEQPEYPGYCWPCGSYWEDVENGLWDSPLYADGSVS